MSLLINEEQQMLKTSAREFLNKRSPVSSLRFLRDTQDPNGYDPAIWQEMVEMGWTSLTIPEAYGGLDFGYTGLGQVLEESGRTLLASPLVSTVLLGTTLINLGGNEEQKAGILPAIAEGGLLVAVAFEEHQTHRPLKIATTATKSEDGYTLNGKKVFVLDGHIADMLIVTAQTDEGMGLFLVPADTEGVNIQRRIMMDSRNAATIFFENVEVTETLGKAGKSEVLLNHALDIARIGLSAEMLGSMQEAFDRTVGYLKERHQFGVPIGTFQGLQHRAAQMYCEIELCKSLVLKALHAIDARDKKLPALASMVKAKVGETLKLVTNEGIQMFGGIGMTDDEEIGFFMKRARVAQQTFGDYNYHLDRFARLNGF